MHTEFCTKLNFLEGEYAIMQKIGFLLSWVGNPWRYVVLRPCKIRRILWMPSIFALRDRAAARAAALSPPRAGEF